MRLDELKPAQGAFITKVSGSGALRHHLLDMGLTPRTEVTLQKTAPMGDPIQIKIRGYELTLRLEEARNVEIDGVHTQEAELYRENRLPDIDHPGVGELDHAPKAHKHKGAQIPRGHALSFALIGNQNCGKTTLFNQLTGSNQHVGNFPGVTVDRKDGQIRKHPEARVTDLPGIYSLSPYSSEEIVTRDFLLQEHPDGIINIVDAMNLERNLYLTMQLMELELPMVLALNMMDEVRDNGGSVRINELEAILGIPVVPIAAAKNEGVDELIDHAMHVARHRTLPSRIDFCRDSGQKGDPIAAVHRAIHATVHMIEPEAGAADMPARFAATKLIEKDHLMAEKLHIPPEKHEAFGHIVDIMEQDAGMDAEAAMANMRFSFITMLCRKTLVRPHESREHRRSVAIDRLLTGKYTAIPSFFAIMGLIFVMTFSGIGAVLSDWMEAGVDAVKEGMDFLLTASDVNPVVHSLVIHGVADGVGSVISFLPTIVTLFFLSVDSGRYRLYGAGGLCHGPAAAPHWLVGAKHCADADRIRLLGSRHHVDADFVQRTRPENDGPAYAVYELQRKASHIYADDRRIFPAGGSGADDDLSVWVRDYHGPRLCAVAAPDAFPGRAGSLRHGAAELPPPLCEERRPADLG